MIPNPLALRLDPSQHVREQIREAAALGARGVVIDAVGDLGPARLSETGRRELRFLLRSAELSLAAVSLPTRRGFDTADQLDDRLRRADAAFAMAYELGTRLVLVRAGAIPAEEDSGPRSIYLGALEDLGRRADHRGVILALETGPDSGEKVRSLIEGLANPALAASIDPASLMQNGHDPGETARALGRHVVHAYATEGSSGSLTLLARRSGLPAGAVDWEEYVGSLEEVNYRGPLTIWPDPARDRAAQFKAIATRLREL
ncbi:MAG: TIM barrel protein [Isosphaeraceae bacterium]